MPGGKAPKRKGARWERECAEIFKNRAGIDEIKRGIGQSRSAHEVADVDGVPGYWIECKHGKNTAPKRALRQAETALAASKIRGKVPISVCKDDRERPTVTMYLDDFLDLAYPKPIHERAADAVQKLFREDPVEFAKIVRETSPICEEQYDFDICRGASFCGKLKGHSGAHA